MPPTMSSEDPNIPEANAASPGQSQTESPGGGQVPSWGAKRCPSCYAAVLPSQTVCAECGTRLAPRVTKARCLRCGKQATTDHVICPHCGRNLHAAPSRLLTVGLPAVIVSVLAIVLVARGMPSILQGNENLPILQNFEITPIASDSEPTVRLARESLAPAVVQSGPGRSESSVGSEDGQSVVEDFTPTPAAEATDSGASGTTATQEPTSTPVPTIAATANEETATGSVATETAVGATDTATPEPIATSTSTVIATATETATVTVTPTPGSLVYTIRAGDTIVGIADRYDIPQEELLAANSLSRLDATRLQIGDQIILPGIVQFTPTPTATPVAPESPTPSPSG